MRLPFDVVVGESVLVFLGATNTRNTEVFACGCRGPPATWRHGAPPSFCPLLHAVERRRATTKGYTSAYVAPTVASIGI